MSGMRTYDQAYMAIVGRKSATDPDPERVAAANRAAMLSDLLRDQGCVTRAWYPGSKRPWCHRTGYYWEWDRPTPDHPYRLVHKSTEREIFCFEPYGFGKEHIIKLAELQAQEWHVWVDAWMALHFPARTLVVKIEEESKFKKSLLHR